MSAALSRAGSLLVTSPALREARRRAAHIGRALTGRPALVRYFHQADDPYSHLAAQALARLSVRYRITLAAHLVPPPEDAAAPDRERLGRWSLRDATELAGETGLAFATTPSPPDPALVALANAALAVAMREGRFAAAAPSIGEALWRGDADALRALPGDDHAAAAALRDGQALRARLGHYLGATFHCGGEWYWGIDRLHYLEARLAAEGLAVATPALPMFAPREVGCDGAGGAAAGSTLDFFCSLRSPYTYLAAPRVRRLAAHYGARLRLRFVLPMAMRGLPVPRSKRIYILRDAKREADRLGMRFGSVADPLGAPVERGLAVLHRAIAEGKGEAFLESFLQGAFADGIDAGAERGLRRIAGRAGLDARAVAAALADPSWRRVAEDNRALLLSLGLWGVPSFRVDDRPARWGQDRLPAVERDLIAAGRSTRRAARSHANEGAA